MGVHVPLPGDTVDADLALDKRPEGRVGADGLGDLLGVVVAPSAGGNLQQEQHARAC